MKIRIKRRKVNLSNSRTISFFKMKYSDAFYTLTENVFPPFTLLKCFSFTELKYFSCSVLKKCFFFLLEENWKNFSRFFLHCFIINIFTYFLQFVIITYIKIIFLVSMNQRYSSFFFIIKYVIIWYQIYLDHNVT